MHITDADVEEFRQLVYSDRGVDLSPDEARAAVHRVLTLLEAFSLWLAKERAVLKCRDGVPPRMLPDV